MVHLLVLIATSVLAVIYLLSSMVLLSSINAWLSVDFSGPLPLVLGFLLVIISLVDAVAAILLVGIARIRKTLGYILCICSHECSHSRCQHCSLYPMDYSLWELLWWLFRARTRWFLSLIISTNLYFITSTIGIALILCLLLSSFFPFSMLIIMLIQSLRVWQAAGKLWI